MVSAGDQVLHVLAIKGATGAASIHLPYQPYWVEDSLFYPLDTSPECLVLLILSWPAVLGRMAQAYPGAAQGQGKKANEANLKSRSAAGC